MSLQERGELQALAIWLLTFPCVQKASGQKTSRRDSTTPVDLADKDVLSAILEAAGEICGSDENENENVSTSSLQGQSGNLWDTILTLTLRLKGKKTHVQTHITPHTWSHAAQHAALAALLDAAVSHPILELRKEYIGRIMGLPPDVQRALMSLIERRKTSKTPKKSLTGTKTNRDKARNVRTSFGDASPLTSPNRVGRALNHNINNNNTGSSSTEKRHSPRRTFEQAFPSTPSTAHSKRTPPSHIDANSSFLSPGLGDNAAVEQEFQALHEETAQLKHELALKDRRERQLQEQLEQAEADFRQKLIKVEADASRRHDDTCADHQRQLDDLKSQLVKLQDQLQKATRAESQLAVIQDERDILRHTQQQLVETRERLSTYREKVQHLADIKNALQREEEAHSKSVEDCLRLRNELQSLQPLQRQLEEYKQRATEAEFRLTETQDTLTKLQEEKLLNGTASNDLERTCQAQQEEIRELRLRLQHETRSMEGGDTAGVGDGLSELNPDLKEEIERLRSENNNLRVFRDSRQGDAVAKMEERLDDANRLAERYKTQYLSIRDQFERKQRHLAASKSREAKLRDDVHDGLEKIKQTQAVVEDVSQQLHLTQEEVTALRNRETELETELTKWMESGKETQEKSNFLAGEYRSCANMLEACQTRNAKLIQEVAQLSQELREEQESNKKINCEMTQTQETVQATERQASDLRAELEMWIAKCQKLEHRVATLNGQIDAGKSMLAQGRAKEERLAAQAAQATQFLAEANNKGEELVANLSQVREELFATKAELSACEDRESQLLSSLSAMTHRADDAEAKSQQRKERADSLGEALESSQTQLRSLQAKEIELQQLVSTLTKRSEVSEQRSQELQAALSETIHKLSASKRCNDENKDEILRLTEELSGKATEVENWKKQAIAATDEVRNLQEQINQIQQTLRDLNVDLQTSHSNEENMGESVHHAKHIIIALEDTIEKEVKSRLEVENQLEQAQADISNLRDEYEVARFQLSCQVEERSEQVVKFKQDIFRAEEQLTEAQSSLNASEHREKMLQLEISRLHDDVMALQQEISSTKQAMERLAAESSQSAESTCNILQEKAQQELNDLECRMNALLAEERRVKRESEESYQTQIKELKSMHKQKVAELQGAAQQSHEENARTKQIELQNLRRQYEDQLANLKRVSDDANAQLVARGRGMLQEVKAKANEEHDALRKDYQELELRLVKEQEAKEKITLQAKARVAGAKKKLEFASARISTLTNEVDELESRVKSLEREKFKLSEENDHYRRQIGGRGGPDSKLQAQFEQLQKEFKSAMEEARELRRKLKEKEDVNALSGQGWLESITERDDPSYSRNAVNQSTLGQLRAEYEETIEALNDEKRELVMKNSAAATDVQKAEKRAWECEKENAQLKQLNTSLQLRVERLAQLMDSIGEEDAIPPPPPPTQSCKKSPGRLSKAHSTLESRDPDDYAFEQMTTMTEPSSVFDNSGIHDTREVIAANEAINRLPLPVDPAYFNSSGPPETTLSPMPASKAHDLPPFVQFHASSDTQLEGPPECQQS